MSTKDSNVYNNSTIVKSYLEGAKECGKTVTNSFVDSWYYLGQEFHTTGELKVVKTEIDGRTVVYVALVTKEGYDLPIKSVMSISSLQGYETEGEFISESRGKDGRIIVMKFKAEVVDGFRFQDVYQPTTRQLLSFIADANERKLFVGKTVRYLGMAVRPYVARKSRVSPSHEMYDAGMKRAIPVRLWQVYD